MYEGTEPPSPPAPSAIRHRHAHRHSSFSRSGLEVRLFLLRTFSSCSSQVFKQPSFLDFWHSNEETARQEYTLQYETQGAGPNRLAPNGKRSERSTIREASPTLQKILRCPFSIFRIFIVVFIFESIS